MQTVTNETELLLNSRSLGVLQDDNLEEPFTLNQRLYVSYSLQVPVTF